MKICHEQVKSNVPLLDNNNGDSQDSQGIIELVSSMYRRIKPFILLGTRWIVNQACHRLNQAGRSACIDLNENKMPKTFLDFYTRLKIKELIRNHHVNLTTSPDLMVISSHSL